MAEENEDGQEKSEEPTARRLEKAKEEGQVARSRELGTMAVVMTGALGLLIFGPLIGKGFEAIFVHNMSLTREDIFEPTSMSQHLLASALELSLRISPLMGLLYIAGIAGTLAVGGWLFSGKAIAPKFNRMSPLQGIKKMFSMQALVELLKGIAKVSLVLAIALMALNLRQGDILAIASEAPVPAMQHTLWTLGWVFFALSSATIVIALIDVPFQIFSHKKKMRMTKQEVKDEFKETEGKPEVKGKIRQLQMEMAQRRMMQEVPKADVVITNPEHYAVALKYDSKTMVAPVVLAKGTDQTAMKIQEIAREHKIDLLRTPPLARAVYHSTDIGEEIPAGLYMAVAQILAYLFQLRQFRRGQGERPRMPDMPIPDDLRRDE
ncbi:flagellar biosynthesis protein FlhB [Marinobacteraceae bacterium S3BR75-40.1]